MVRSHFALAASLTVLIAVAGCDTARRPAGPVASNGSAGVGSGSSGPTPIDLATCTRCHGDPRYNAAPPFSVKGATATTDVGVGAHQQHLANTHLRAPLSCDECHVVPSKPSDKGHMDGTAPVVSFTGPRSTGLASMKGASPKWDATQQRCSNVYCHGATLNAGGANVAPRWTGGAPEAACGTCHGVPPLTSTHPVVTGGLAACAACHPATMKGDGTLDLAGGKHIDGVVQASGGHPAGWSSPGAHGVAANTGGVAACATCHGDVNGNGGSAGVACASCHGPGGPGNDFTSGAPKSCTSCHGDAAVTALDGAGVLRAPAPPRATLGNTRPSGRHAEHLTPGALASAAVYACAQCHVAPSKSLHATGSVELAWGSLAAPPAKLGADGNPVAPSFDPAANTCSNTYCHGNFKNGNARTMSWTGPLSDAACGTCHGLPPAGTHPTIGSQGCGTCHPGYSGAAGGAITVNQALHMNGQVDSTGNHPANWQDPANHGLAAVNVALNPGGPQSCTACHVAYGSAGTPTAPGVTTSSCNTCHAAAGHAGWVNECTFCHGGNDNQTGAPARDTHALRGTVQPTTSVTVGAHTSHAGGAGATPHGIDTPLACSECHVTPSGAVDSTAEAGHIDGTTATVTFGGTSKLGSAAPAWNRTAATCASTYCHGATLNATTTRGTAATPVWTTVNGTQSTCGSCHKSQPGTANHHNAAAVTTCAKCHGGTVDATGAIAVASGKHINGAVDTQGLTCTTCHGGVAPPAAAGQDANVAAAPTGTGAPDTYGLTASSSAGVGVHLSHVAGARSKPVLCSACHVVPTVAIHKTGAASAGTVTFASLATTGGKTPTYAGAGGSCSATYCHGNFTGGAGTGATPAWTAAGTLGCAACHGAPPATSASSPHPPNAACGSCHTGYGASTVVAATHVDGTVNVSTSGCTSCHGDLSVANAASTDVRVAPAGDANAVDAHGNPATATTVRGVGAHAKHLTSTTYRSTAMACSECHVVPATGDKTHANGTAAVAFGALARTVWSGGTAITPAYDTTTLSCATTYCHGAFKNGASAAPVWTSPGTVDCTSCHGTAGVTPLPGGTHPNNSACGNCHDAAYSWNGTTKVGTVNTSQHLNGVLDVPNMSCTSCHGTAGRAAVAGVPDATKIPVYPPVAATGSTVTPGAHTAHVNQLGGSQVRSPMACAECHSVPTSNTHSTGAIDMTWGALAKTGGTTPAFTKSSGTTAASCANYCHGTWTGTYAAYGAKATIAWNAASTTCTSCHGAPPPLAAGSPHPQNVNCASCHGTGYAQAAVTGAALTTHVDGFAQITTSGCTSCHGDLSVANAANTDVRVAPAGDANAVDAHGNPATATTVRGVGAHKAHLTAGPLAGALACAECHVVPATGDKAHATGPTATVTFGTLARTGTVTPSWNGTTLTCASAYCHGNFKNGTTTNAPSWTGSGQAACGTCHGIPPAGTHPAVAAGVNCGTCHPGYNATPGSTSGTVNLSLHVNGQVDSTGHPANWQDPANHGLAAINVALNPGGPQSCTGCHVAYGSAGTPTAPGVTTSSCNTCHAAAGHASWVNECTFCHGGNDNQTGAPARDTHALRGTVQPTTSVMVGAHTSHVGVGGAGATPHGIDTPLACSECHVTPSGAVDATAEPGHIDGTTATVTFGGTSKLGSATPAWNRTAATCASTYCHGATLNATTTRGTAATPVWTTVNGAQSTCGSCHKSQPGTANHHNAAAVTTCAKCHGGTVDATGAIAAASGKHVNGAIDTQGLTCTTCHGGVAPPAAAGQDANVAAAPTGAGAPDTYGFTASSNAGVGVHLSHVAGARSKPVLCNACHVVPTVAIHKTGAATAGTVAFANLATTGGKTPTYAGAGGSCSATYCHGNFTGGAGTGATPAWTAAGTLGCASCHGAPPAISATVPHPPNAACGSCHAGYGPTAVVAATHIDGTVTVSTSGCTACHGDLAVANAASTDVRAAPGGDATAVDAHGNPATATTVRGVGAHAKHLTSTTYRSTAMACSECHVVPATGDKTHANGTAAVAFGALAKTVWSGGTAIAPAYDTTTLSCATTYCHGAFKNGASAAPAWTSPGTVDCTSCHGTAGVTPLPGGTHPQNSACANCHDAAYSWNGTTKVGTVNTSQHLNGVLDVPNMSCTSCHGTAGRAAVAGVPDATKIPVYPPVAATGSTVTPGAHTAHVNQLGGSQVRSPMACAECHAVPTSNTHSTGAIDMTWGVLAKTGGTTPAFTKSTGTTAASCANYCHGTWTGTYAAYGAKATIAWNAASTTCTSCHGAPPAAPHPANSSCGSCHGAGYASTSVTGAALATHVDGIAQITTSGCTTCHGDLSVANAANTDVRVAPAGDANAVDAHGNPATATTVRGVGAHAKHLTSTTYRSTAMACSECHVVPATGDKTHANGTAAVAFGALARTVWSGGTAITPAYDTTTLGCATTYCHGAFKNGASAAPVWTSPGTVDCTSCHGTAGVTPLPGGTHPNNSACANCHDAAYSWNGTTKVGTVNTTQHLNGVLDVPNMSCTSCHGTAGRAAVAGVPDATKIPVYPPVAATGSTVTPGAHTAHVNQLGGSQVRNPMACAECHSVPTSNTHSTGAIDMTWGALAKTGGTTPAFTKSSGTTAASCANYCHGTWTGTYAAYGAKATIAWNAASTTCTSCHGAPPPLAAGSPHPQNVNCASCHGTGYAQAAVTGAALTTHVDGFAQITTSGCTSCHGDLTVTNAANTNPATAPGYSAAAVDTKGNTATSARGVGAHKAHLTAGPLAGALACAECHVVPATGDKAHATGPTATVTFGTLARTGTVTPSWNGTTLTCASAYCHGNFKNGTTTNAPSWTGSGQAACGTCHGIPPAGTHPAVAAGVNCGTCHPGYNATPGSTSGTVNLSLHVNGVVDGGGESAGGTNCGGCHATILNGMAPTSTKVSKHTIGSDVPTDSGGPTWANPLSSVAAASRSCVNMCHGDHTHDLTSPVVATHEYNVYLDATSSTSRNGGSAGRTSAYRDNTDFDAAQANGGLCVSCHRNPVDANHPAVDKTAFGASAHAFTSKTVGTTTYTWQYTLHDGGAYQRNCTKCHASQAEGQTPTMAVSGSGTVGPHSSDFGSLLAGDTHPATANGTLNTTQRAKLVCYNCHGNATVGNNLSGKDVATVAESASAHPIETDAVHNTVTEDAAALGSSLGGAARHASCLDCHDPHQSKAGLHAAQSNLAGGAILGASGAKFSNTNVAAWGQPTAADFTKVPALASTDLEATLCLKCHSAASWGTGTPPHSPGSGTPGWNETDLAKEFNTKNASYHSVLGANTATRARSLKAPWTASSVMTCSDCHGSSATGAVGGPHGSANAFVLKGTWNASLSAFSSSLCANCHSAHPNQDGTGGGHHGATCFSCHSAIPHGAPRASLVISPAGTALAGGLITGYDAAASPYNQSGSNKLYLKSYPAPGGSWSKTNCGCNGTGH